MIIHPRRLTASASHCLKLLTLCTLCSLLTACPQEDSDEALTYALATGDVSQLSDPAPIMTKALAHAQALFKTQSDLIASIYTGTDSQYDPGRQSQLVVPGNPETTQPLIVGDGGHVLASLSMAHGRAAAYGHNIADAIRNGTNTAHAPALRRVAAWLLTGDAGATLPTGIRISAVGLNAGNTVTGLGKAGITVTDAACNALSDQACAAKVTLVVVGSGVAASGSLTQQAQDLLASGKPVLYLHTNASGGSDGGSQVLAAMNLSMPYAGNYFSQDKVPAGRGLATQVGKTAQFAKVIPLLDRLARNGLRTDYDWSKCTSYVGKDSCDAVPGLKDDLIAPSEQIRGQLNALTQAGVSPFGNTRTRLLGLLSLWADVTRKQIVYPMDKQASTVDFQRALVADAWVSYVRAAGGQQNDLGTFGGKDPAPLPVSTADETLTVTLNGASGFTGVGRYAVPGQPLQVTLLDSTAANVSLQLNVIREGAQRMWNPKKYDRPHYVTSPKLPLKPGQNLTVVSPYGGTLALSFSDADKLASVKLRVRGAGTHAFLDTTTGDSGSSYGAQLASSPFPWTEIKLGNLEIHSRTDKMRETLSKDYGNDFARFKSELLNYLYDGVIGLAGYAQAGKTLPTPVLAFCSARGWDCANTAIHASPGTQHINVDVYANCGGGCGGNPYDQSWNLSPRGWGESHEMGHNNQPEMLRVYSGRSGEVSNNIFPLQKNWRLYRDLGVDQANDRVNYRSAFDLLIKARQNAAPIDAAYDALWANDAYAVQNGERLAFYMQWVHYWQQRTGDAAQAWDIYTLLYLHHRLFSKGDWATYRDRLGYGSYATRPGVNGNDNLLIALSTITQRDQRPTFDLWGIKYSAEASAQVTAFGYAREPAFFYANNQTNDHTTVRRVDMSGASPAWPFLADGRYRLVAAHSGKCVGIVGSGDGARATQATCTGDNTQLFELTGTGGGLHKLVNLGSRKALDVNGASTADGASIQQWTDNGSGAQRFSMKPSVDGGFALVNQASGKCVDVTGASSSEGAALIQWSCHGQANQSFKLSPG